MRPALLLATTAAGLFLGASTLASAQDQPGASQPRPDSAQPGGAQPGAASKTASPGGAQPGGQDLQVLVQEVQLLLQQQADFKKQQQALSTAAAQNDQRIADLLVRLQAATGKPFVPPPGVTPPAVTPTAPVAAAPKPPPTILFKGDVALRTEDTHTGTVQTGVVPVGDRSSLRARFRLMAIAPVSDRAEAALQITTGQGNPGTPTIPSFALGDIYRAKSIGFGLAYFGLHFGPAEVRRRPSLLSGGRGPSGITSGTSGPNDNDFLLLVGKMPNPFWRADAGGFSSEMIWSRYVAPEGLSLRMPLSRPGSRITVNNTLGYFRVVQQPDAIFQGEQTNVWSIVNQLKVDANWIKGGAEYIRYSNLNSGLHVPSFTTGLTTGASGGVDNPDAFIDPNAATLPFLLRPDVIQVTNNRGSFGGGQLTGVSGFVTDHYDIMNLTGQILPGRIIPSLRSRKYQPFITLDYAHNFAVSRDRNGYSATFGVGHDPAGNDITRPGPPLKGAWSAWLTYRDVDADATLATFTDSDFGAGTDYRGGELGLNYRLRPDFLAQVLVTQWDGHPRKTNTIRRLFLDFVKFF